MACQHFYAEIPVMQKKSFSELNLKLTNKVSVFAVVDSRRYARSLKS